MLNALFEYFQLMFIAVFETSRLISLICTGSSIGYGQSEIARETVRTDCLKEIGCVRLAAFQKKGGSSF